MKFSEDQTEFNGYMSPLFNHDFQNFAHRTEFGRNFRVVSPLYEIPKEELDFTGKEIVNDAICWKVGK